jgi:hypothetical protein
MKNAAIGVRTHSGWGAVVAVSGDASSSEVIARARVSVIDPNMKSPFQPYHRAAKMKVSEAETYLARSATDCKAIAVAALRQVLDELHTSGYRIMGCSVLLGSGRTMPPFEKILTAHPMLHTAEGIFFRKVFQDAFDQLNLRVTGIPERDLDERCKIVFGRRAPAARQKIARMGKSLGPPWTTDQKLAAVAAWIVLASRPAR